VSGAGVLVAVLDGGFNLRHPVISARLAPFGRDVLDGDDDPNDPGNGVDDDLDGIVDRAVGHGTFVAGMVLLAAPDATILPVRVCNDEGRSGPLDWWGLGGGLGGSLNGDAPLFRGILFALAAGARVINLSTKDAEDSVDVAFAIAEAEARGVTVVVSAGNDGLPLWKDVPGTVVVGAVDAIDVRADFTSFAAGWGTLGDRFLFAPGVDLHGAFGGYFDESIAWWSGTSFAAGIVSGAAALYLSAWGPVEPAWVARVLLSGADPVPGEAARRLDLWRMLWS
jgi:subtilisin family serine protease